MSDTKHFIETYRGHDIYYDENSEKFTCDISIEDNFKSTSRVSLKACRQEIDTFIKDNLNFKPFKLFNFGYHLDFTGDINEYEAIGVRSHDGALIIEGESQYTKGEKRKEYKKAGEYGAEGLAAYNADLFNIEKEWKEHEAIWDKKKKELKAKANKLLKPIDWTYIEQFKKKV